METLIAYCSDVMETAAVVTLGSLWVLVQTRGGPCQHGLVCVCDYVSSGVMIGPFMPK